MEIDYLIIGQGLAGSLLAWELIQRQKKVIIVDNNKENASLVAAGLITPVTGMRFVKSSDVDILLPAALNYYQQLSLYFQQSFYIEKPMQRILRSDKELAISQQRLLQPEYQDYLDIIIDSFPAINTPFGLLNQKQTGYLLTLPLLSRLKKFFIANNTYINTSIDYDDIKLSPSLQWRHYLPEQLIFCEGHYAIKNPWFSWLPFQPVKGEIITATSKQTLQTSILNYGHWFIPLNAYQFRTGATFDRETLETNITTEAKETLLSSLRKNYPEITIDCIIKQQAGVRPTTLDKQPFIGKHPRHPELLMFNGFGAKGSLQIPWYCQCLADHLSHNRPIPQASHIRRFFHE